MSSYFNTPEFDHKAFAKYLAENKLTSSSRLHSLNEGIEEAVGPDRITNLNDKISRLQLSIAKLDKSKPESKTKEAILKSDLNTAKLRLTDIMKQNAAKAVNEAIKAKQSYKSLKMSLKKEQDMDNKKKTLTDKPITKIEVNPKIEG